MIVHRRILRQLCLAWGFAVSLAAAADPLPPAPRPPALPFKYGGGGVVNGKTILFLEQQNGSVMAETGDTVGAYRIEAIEPNRALLRYLPLDVVQILSFGASGNEVLPASRPAPPPSVRGPLFVNLPDELPLGEERSVLVGIAPGSAAAKASIEFNYDVQELTISGASIVRPGRALIEVSAQEATRSKEIRLRAIAPTAVHTEIGIAVTAFDAQGKRLEVGGIPALHIVNLVDERG